MLLHQHAYVVERGELHDFGDDDRARQRLDARQRSLGYCGRPNSSGNFAILAAIRRASSRVSRFGCGSVSRLLLVAQLVDGGRSGSARPLNLRSFATQRG